VTRRSLIVRIEAKPNVLISILTTRSNPLLTSSWVTQPSHSHRGLHVLPSG
jgi:hypothetical protein